MIYKSMSDCILDLERHGDLLRIAVPVDPDLEMAEIHRRVHAAGGPAILFERVKGSPFPAVSNLYGTLDRARFLFRSTLDGIRRLMELHADPAAAFDAPSRFTALPRTLWRMRPKRVHGGGVLRNTTTIDRLPAIRCWPEDGGPFILLPQVYSENPDRPGILRSNLGMYRVQLAGNDYAPNREIGLHYQIRRDIAAHHADALERQRPLRVSIFVGGPPAHAFAAVMPLPEGLPEVAFAGGLAGRRFRYALRDGHTLSTDADFCITGTIVPGETRPEGPFGDHLGYYSLAHPFPFVRVERVYHRAGAIWPFTVVGRPPQEDSVFGKLVHEITGPAVPVAIPGLCAVNAVDAAGVHPLLLAIGRERFVPYGPREPRELLKLASAILGFGHMALAKYLFITAREDNPELDISDPAAFFAHLLERVDWRRDLHFQTRTTIDTLDYTGTGFNAGSKVVIAAAGERVRTLQPNVPPGLSLPEGFHSPAMVLPGILAVTGPGWSDPEAEAARIKQLGGHLKNSPGTGSGIPLVVVSDDAPFTARTQNNFLWITFTRSNPSHDIHGVDAFVMDKHWGCRGALIIDARIKPHHAPPLEPDPKITARVEEMGKKGGPLHGWI